VFSYPLETLIFPSSSGAKRPDVKFSIISIGDGLDLTFKRDKESVDAMMEITKGDFRGTDYGMHVSVRVDKIQDTLLLQGIVGAGLTLKCVRCLKQRERIVKVTLEAVLFPIEQGNNEEIEVELSTEDMNVSFYDPSKDEFDLTDLVREALLLDMPVYPSCSEEEECVPYKASEEEIIESQVDPRWQGLLALKKSMGQIKSTSSSDDKSD
jgi:uncharacterized metal-binding protein YceD (DUF177 family)